MSRSWCIASFLVVGMVGSGFLMGDDKKDPIVVRASLPRYYSQLGLSPKQRNDVYKVRGKYAAEIQELLQKINELREQERSECEKVLTAAQKARLKELFASGKKGVGDDDDAPVNVDKKKGGPAPKEKSGPTEVKK